MLVWCEVYVEEGLKLKKLRGTVRPKDLTLFFEEAWGLLVSR